MAAGTGETNKLWVSYADPSTMRRRVVGVAQQVLDLLERSQIQPLPQLVIPKGQRARHGFWFMKFAEEEKLTEALEELDGQPFRTRCGSLQGVLDISRASGELQLYAMLMMEAEHIDGVEVWLARTFEQYGPLDAVNIPRLKCNWDGGMGFVTFQHSEDALSALRALDGTPSCISGCNMVVDFQRDTPLLQTRFLEEGSIQPPRFRQGS